MYEPEFLRAWFSIREIDWRVLFAVDRLDSLGRVRRKAGSLADDSSLLRGYRRVWIPNPPHGTSLYAHCVIYALYHNVNPVGWIVDHIHRDKLNNDPRLMRLVDPRTSGLNRDFVENTATGFIGVTRRLSPSGKISFECRVTDPVSKRRKTLGYHKILS